MLVDQLLTLIASVSTALLVIFILTMLCNTRSGKKLKPKEYRVLEKQLPAFLDAISSNLSVGISLQQSIEICIQKDQNHIGEFFKTILLKVKSGMTLDASFELQAQQLAGGSLALALLSMASSYRSGSNIMESLSLLSTLCREREYLHKKILARTAQSRMQGYVLIFVPILFMLLLFVVSPQNMLPVLNTNTGRILLGAAATLQCIGGFTIRAMLKQEIL